MGRMRGSERQRERGEEGERETDTYVVCVITNLSIIDNMDVHVLHIEKALSEGQISFSFPHSYLSSGCS